MARIERLVVYPIKSCAGVAVDRAQPTPEGLQYDRRWMVVDAVSHKACTARQFPRMVLIKPRLSPSTNTLRVVLPPSEETESAWLGLRSRTVVREVEFDLPLELRAEELAQWERFIDLDLWSLHLTALAPPPSHPANLALSAFLGRAVRVVCQDRSWRRGAGKKAPREGETGYGAATTDHDDDLSALQVFSDTYALHILTLSSLRSLSLAFAGSPFVSPSSASSPPPSSATSSHNGSTAAQAYDPSIEAAIARFRPNIVVDTDVDADHASTKGEGTYPEDEWGLLEVDEAERVGGESSGEAEKEDRGREGRWDISVVGRCGRCTLPNVDPSTGVRHAALPYKLLTAARPKEVDEFVGVPCPTLGVYAVPLLRKTPSTTSTTVMDARGAPARQAVEWRVGDRIKVCSTRVNVDYVAPSPRPGEAAAEGA